MDIEPVVFWSAKEDEAFTMVISALQKLVCELDSEECIAVSLKGGYVRTAWEIGELAQELKVLNQPWKMEKEE